MYGGGYELWKKYYADFNLLPLISGNSGVQMGGWFNKKINTIDDYKGLKMRIPGLGGKVVAKAGGTVVLTPGGEIFTNLERGVIDATEWVGPYNDLAFGLYQAARYYYYPGWQEPCAVLELSINQAAFEGLPADLTGTLVFNQKDGEFVPRLMLPLSLSYDHRLVDGADAARFLRWVAEALESRGHVVFELDPEGDAPDPLDRATLESERDYTLRIRDRESRLIKKIRQSLKDIENGTYEIDEEKIADKMLKDALLNDLT